MTFDAGTWWLITIIVTTVVGLVGFLFGRSVFRQLDAARRQLDLKVLQLCVRNAGRGFVLDAAYLQISAVRQVVDAAAQCHPVHAARQRQQQALQF